VSAELEALVADIAALHDQVAGTVRLGVLGTTGRWLAPPLLAALAERHPAVHLVVIEGTTTSLASQLIDSRLDLALVNLPVPGADLQATPLFDEDLVLVVPADDPMARRRQVDLRDLEGLMLLLPLRGTAFRDEIEAAARAAGVTLSARTELDGVRLLASLAFEGNGPAILPATAVPRYLEDRWRPIAVTGLPRRRIGLASRRRGLPSAPVRVVRALIEEIVRAGAPAHPGVHPVAIKAAMRSD
jgi:DNA-binding transcriptional LysR family regulator